MRFSKKKTKPHNGYMRVCVCDLEVDLTCCVVGGIPHCDCSLISTPLVDTPVQTSDT